MTEEATAAAAAIITHAVERSVSLPGVMFVPGPNFTGQICTGYHSAHDDDDEDDESHTDNNPNLYNHDDIENQTHTTTLIEAYTVPENDDEAAVYTNFATETDPAGDDYTYYLNTSGDVLKR